jgi:hypothetical protein
MLASAVVGASAGVEPNSYNTYASQLKTKEEELKNREARVASAERGSGSGNALALLSFGMSTALFALLAINFYLDWKRRVSVVGNPLAIVLKRRG